MCVEIHSTLCSGVTQEVYVLKGIRKDLLTQIQEPSCVELYHIYNRLGELESLLEVDSEVYV